MRVIIHAGLPKTGSTAIQSTLALNREKLAQAGFVYPDLNPPPLETSFLPTPGKHVKLAAFWSDRITLSHRVAREIHDGDVETWSSAVKLEVADILSTARACGDTVIFSSEALGRPELSHGLGNFLSTINRFTDNIHLLGYVRHPVDLYTSSLQQRIRLLGRSLERLRPSRWRSPQEVRVNTLRNRFGADRLTVRIYAREALIGHDIVADFGEFVQRTCGRSLPVLEPSHNDNASVSAPACAILTMLRRILVPGLDDLEQNKTAQLLRLYSSQHPAPRLQLPLAWKAAIEARNGASWNRILESAPDAVAFRIHAAKVPMSMMSSNHGSCLTWTRIT